MKKSCVSKSYDNLHDNEIIWIERFFLRNWSLALAWNSLPNCLQKLPEILCHSLLWQNNLSSEWRKNIRIWFSTWNFNIFWVLPPKWYTNWIRRISASKIQKLTSKILNLTWKKAFFTKSINNIRLQKIIKTITKETEHFFCSFEKNISHKLPDTIGLSTTK